MIISVVDSPGDDLLTRHSIGSTTDPAVFSEAARNIFGASNAELRHSDEANPARASLLQLPELVIGYSACEGTVTFPQTDYARQQFALKGTALNLVGSRARPVDLRNSAINNPGDAVAIDHGRGFSQLFIRIGRDVLDRKLAALLGANPNSPLELAAGASLSDSRVAMLRNLVVFFAREVDRSERGMPALVLQEMQQAVIVAFLAGNRHNFSDWLGRDAAPAGPGHVRLAEEFIRANWHRAIMVEELAAVSGVAIRTLFKSFRRSRGYSPHQFAKRVRLERARDMLKGPAAETTVSSVAQACGFTNLGHFARDYRKAFGELPSATLASAIPLTATDAA